MHYHRKNNFQWEVPKDTLEQVQIKLDQAIFSVICGCCRCMQYISGSGCCINWNPMILVGKATNYRIFHSRYLTELEPVLLVHWGITVWGSFAQLGPSERGVLFLLFSQWSGSVFRFQIQGQPLPFHKM